MVVPKMKKAGDESPAVEAHFSTELTIHLLSASVNQNFHTGQGGPLLSSRPPPPVISNGASRLFSSASLLRSGRLAQREISLPLSSVRRLRRDRAGGLPRFWQPRFYDFNAWSKGKVREKLEYMHANPVTRKLVHHPKDWPWSSWSFYAKGEDGLVAIDSVW